MRDTDMIHQTLDWVGLLLALAFILIGLGILSGLILKGSFLFGGGMRALVGLVLVAYGIVRGSMTYRRIRNLRKEGKS